MRSPYRQAVWGMMPSIHKRRHKCLSARKKTTKGADPAAVKLDLLPLTYTEKMKTITAHKNSSHMIPPQASIPPAPHTQPQEEQNSTNKSTTD